MAERVEIAIVGGGPAGATLAILLARSGHDVVVLERAVVPRWRACGVFSPTALPLLGGLGILAPEPALATRSGPEPALVRRLPGLRLEVPDAPPLDLFGHAAPAGFARPAFDARDGFRLYLRLLAAALGARFGEPALAEVRARAAARAADDESADAIMDRAMEPLHRDWLADNEQRMRIRRAWGAFFHEWDVLLCPVIGMPALPHIEDRPAWARRITVAGHETGYNDMLFWPGITCGFHLPASVAPLGLTKAGLPIGVQIVGPFYGDRTTLAVARLLERHWRGFAPPPAFM